jgi:hypothetical protein
VIPGDFDLNPFNFRKRWTVTSTDNYQKDIPDLVRSRIVEQKVEQMAKLTQQQSEMNLKLMELLLDQNKKLSEQQSKINDLASSRNKSRGKNSRPDEVRCQFHQHFK